MDEHELMGKLKVSKAVAKMAVPSVISSLVTVVYNMADTFFVGQTGDPLQVAAVSLTNPIFILMMAFANMFGMGGSAVLSMALGAKDERRAKNASSFVTYASLIVGVVFALILIVFMDPILALFGANAETYEFARGYTFHIAYGAPFIIWSAAASFIVRAEGASREAMIGSMIGTIANIVLDPIFISVLGQGTAGAAIATTIGNVMASGYYLWYFLRKSRMLSISWRYFTVRGGILTKICSAGLPTAIFSALMSVSTIVLNQLLVVYGNDPVASIGIVFKANMFITFLQMGLANGVQMLIAYMLSGPVIGILFVNMNCMQSVGHAFPATVLSVLRQGILLIPLLYLLRALFGLNGVILGQSVTDYIAVILSIFMWRKIRGRVEKKQPEADAGETNKI